MSLFIAGEAFPEAADFAAAKIAIFIASLVAGLVGTLILLPKTAADTPLAVQEGPNA
jgi:NhaA family Na+:H+ antiporter